MGELVLEHILLAKGPRFASPTSPAKGSQVESDVKNMPHESLPGWAESDDLGSQCSVSVYIYMGKTFLSKNIKTV